MAGLLAKAKWKPVLAIYAIMLSAYFIHPFGRALPLWTILDILFALFLIYPAAKLSSNLYGTDARARALRLSIVLALISFTVIVTDSLTRVFLLVPGSLYKLFFPDFVTLKGIFVTDAVISCFGDFVAVSISFIAGVPLLITIFKLERSNHE